MRPRRDDPKRTGRLVSQTSMYALRAMAHLASQDPDRYVPSAELSAQVGIPRHYVSKVLRRLGVAGLCDGTRGHRGGFRLARPAAEIAFEEIIYASEPSSNLLACAFGYDACDLEHPCPLHESWAALKAQFAGWAEETPLADVRDYAARPEVGRIGKLPT